MSRVPKHPNPHRPLTEPELHILLSLAEGRRHRYAMMLEARERTDGRISMGAGILYGSLKRMAARGLIEESTDQRPGEGAKEGGRRRYYELTRTGEAALTKEIESMRGYLRTARERGIPSFCGD